VAVLGLELGSIACGSIRDADIGFLDEVFKGSSAILNTLLTIMTHVYQFCRLAPGRLGTGGFGNSKGIRQIEQAQLAALQSEIIWKKVMDWWSKGGKRMFEGAGRTAQVSVAEYLANQEGVTMRELS
jgi:hypothetical protein